jgi:predicted nucleotidyltransferase
MPVRIRFDRGAIDEFCRKWKILEMSLFGSVLREDFGPQSDVDVLVTFEPEPGWGLLDLVRMENELGLVFGRKVDLVERRAIERSQNHFRRNGILSHLEPIHVP